MPNPYLRQNYNVGGYASYSYPSAQALQERSLQKNQIQIERAQDERMRSGQPREYNHIFTNASFNEGGGVAIAPAVNTGIPQGGHAREAINAYLSGATSPISYQAGATPRWVVPPIGTGVGIPQVVVNTPVNTTSNANTDLQLDAYGQDAITQARIADNTAYVADVVAEGGINPATGDNNIAAGPAILDASQVGVSVDDNGSDEYHKNFQSNFAFQSAHADNNQYGQSTGVPIYDQGFTLADGSLDVDSLLPPTGDANAASNAQAQQNIANLQAWSQKTADKGQVEGRQLVAERRNNEDNTRAADLGLSRENYNQLSRAQQLGGNNPNLTSSAIAEVAKTKGTGKGLENYLKEQGLTGEAFDETLRGAKAEQAYNSLLDQGFTTDEASNDAFGEGGRSFFAGTGAPKQVGGGVLSSPATSAAGSGQLNAAKGSDVLASGLTRAETEANNQVAINNANTLFSSSDTEQKAYNQQVASNKVKATAAGLDNLSGSEAKAKLNELGLGNFAKEDAKDTLQSKINSGEIFDAINAADKTQNHNVGGYIASNGVPMTAAANRAFNTWR